MVKVVSIFLIGMLVLGMFGKLRMPKIGLKPRMKATKKCKKCGAYQIGDTPCNCRKS